LPGHPLPLIDPPLAGLLHNDKTPCKPEDRRYRLPVLANHHPPPGVSPAAAARFSRRRERGEPALAGKAAGETALNGV